MPFTWYVLESTENAKRREKIQPVPVPPGHFAGVLYHDDSPRDRFRPADRLYQLEMVPSCFRIPVPPGQGSEGGKSRPLDHMRQIPFLPAAQFHLTTLTKISTDIYLGM